MGKAPKKIENTEDNKALEDQGLDNEGRPKDNQEGKRPAEPILPPPD